MIIKDVVKTYPVHLKLCDEDSLSLSCNEFIGGYTIGELLSNTGARNSLITCYKKDTGWMKQ